LLLPDNRLHQEANAPMSAVNFIRWPVGGADAITDRATELECGVVFHGLLVLRLLIGN
jgi:hypothetical protein